MEITFGPGSPLCEVLVNFHFCSISIYAFDLDTFKDVFHINHYSGFNIHNYCRISYNRADSAILIGIANFNHRRFTS